MTEDTTPTTPDAPESPEAAPKASRRHIIRPKWLRITLKTLMWILIALVLLPLLLYIPPVQTLVKNVACDMVYKSTGMKVEIDRFRLKFPLDVSLQGVTVLDVHRDTMVSAREALLDVKMLPLLALDVKINKLKLTQGYYRMVSPDSSMVLTVRAGLLDTDDKARANMRTGEITLNKALLRDGNLQLYMNVWKQKPTPPDTAKSTPFRIKSEDLKLENFTFGMSMLPTIDTLSLKARDISLKKGVVDLGKNKVSWKLASVAGGSGRYLTPDPKWAAEHPAPPAQPSSGAPMVISGDSISLDEFAMIYAVKGAKPLPGFDASYISVKDVSIGMRGFYNESSTVRLPITRLQARERSGLEIVRGQGIIGVDSTGLSLKDINISTLYSKIAGDAAIPFALMELKPDAPVDVSVTTRLGMPDIDAFMPSLKEYTKLLPARNPLDATLEAHGTLASVDVETLEAELRDVLSISASGYADNALDIKRLVAQLDFEGELSDPRLIDRFTGESGIKVPAFRIEGNAEASNQTYGADFRFTSTAGNAEGLGKVSLNSEHYDADISVERLDVAYFMPTLGIGSVTASVKAEGAGFNPLSGKSTTDARIYINSIEYNKKLLSDIRADIRLERDGVFDLQAVSPNPGLDFDIEGSGIIHKDDYTFDLMARLRDIDLRALGLSPDMSNGKGTVYLKGTASPERWLYSADLKLDDFDWNLPNQYIHLPGGMTARIDAEENSTRLTVDSYMTSLDFDSPAGLEHLVDAFGKAAAVAGRQVEARNLTVDSISDLLPPFRLGMSASGRGLLSQFLVPAGMNVDTIYGSLSKDSLFHGAIGAHRFTTGSLTLDTIAFSLAERGKLLDYRLHVGNRPGTLDEFAQVGIRGYVGGNRAGMFLTQKNVKGETGYRLGLTAAMRDSTVSLHFTPLESTIAYLPWTLNDDNYIDFNFNNLKVDANLLARSAESSILLRTEPTEEGFDRMHLKLDNIRIQDFLSMSVFAPPVTGSINSDINLSYNGRVLRGRGTLGVKELTYSRYRLGDFDLDLRAGMGANGDSGVGAGLKINGEQALAAYARMKNDSTGLHPDSIGLKLTRFPLSIANPFLGNMVAMGGRLNGSMRMDGSFTKPILNGELSFDTVTARIPMAGATLRFDKGPVTVANSVVHFDRFGIYGANDNPITLDGTVDATKFSDIMVNLTMNARNTQLIKSDKRSKADLYGKLFVNLDGSMKGSLNLLDIKANLNILGTTDVTYNLGATPAELSGQGETDVVRFVNFNDTTQVSKADSVQSGMAMRIRAGLTISPGTRATVLLSTNGTDKVELQPTANLSYFQNYMGDMRLNGTLTLGNGFARYAVPVVGEKMFTFNPASTVVWSGDLMNPALNITATDEMKASVSQGGNSRLVNFLVTLTAKGTLDVPKVNFDLSTNDDISIRNELQSMSADQRQTQAMNLLLYGQYTGQNMKANANLGGNMLYSFLESQINSWAAKNIRGVDLTFGIDQYDRMRDGASSTETSYSYQVSKSLFNNRFKIQVGGNYSTDASADENLSQNLISDISIEYILKQTETLNMSVKLFRHTGYESILEGEITETGVGFVMKRKLMNLFHLFRPIRRRRAEREDKTAAMPSAAALKDSIGLPADSIDTNKKEHENEN